MFPDHRRLCHSEAGMLTDMLDGSHYAVSRLQCTIARQATPHIPDLSQAGPMLSPYIAVVFMKLCSFPDHVMLT